MFVRDKGGGIHVAEIAVQATDGQIHAGQLVGLAIGLLAINGDVFLVTLMPFNELCALHEHTAGTAAGIIH